MKKDGGIEDITAYNPTGEEEHSSIYPLSYFPIAH
jgi:hypothetical protein